MKRVSITVILTVLGVLFCHAQSIQQGIEKQKRQEAGKQLATEKQSSFNKGDVEHLDKLTSVSSVLSTRLLTESDLRGFSKQELRILRNEIFARHGYIFKSQDLRDYFSKKDWYKPRYNDVTRLLNTIELKNIAFIKKHE